MLVFAEIGVDTTTVQRVDAPKRDIYVERALDGDRVFASHPNNDYMTHFFWHVVTAELCVDTTTVQRVDFYITQQCDYNTIVCLSRFVMQILVWTPPQCSA
jgi:hypothetical protein